MAVSLLVNATLPQVHAALLGLSAVIAIACGGLILARNPPSTAARLHFLYAMAIAWWFVCAAHIATAASPDRIELWSRLVHLSLGALPAIVYHLNTSLAWLVEERARRVRLHWLLSGVLILFGLLWPGLLVEPREFWWGWHLSYSPWGLVIAVPMAAVMVEVVVQYRVSLSRSDPRMARHRKARAFFFGNLIASLALVSFLPTFGIGVYPFGFLVLTATHAVTLYGSMRYRLIQITPEFAAEQVLHDMPDGVVLTDTQGVIRLANPPAHRCLWSGGGELVGQSVDALDPDCPIVELLRHGDLESPRVVAHKDAEGRERHARVSVSTIKDAAAFPVARLWILRDITDERAAELERGRMEETVRNVQKLESLGVMAAGVAHDFNNLLMAIQGNAELARRTATEAEVTPFLEKIEATAERAVGLTAQMLTYTGHAQMRLRPIDLNQVIGDVAELMSAAMSKKASVSLELRPGLPRIMGDSAQMSQVVLNLMTNASEALEGAAGSIVLRTGVCTSDDSFDHWSDTTAPDEPIECVFLEAEDTGVGMDDETLRRIFDPFFTTKFAGRGLGLPTLLGIVRAHSGVTRVRSEPGRGTRFTIAFPATTDSLPLPANATFPVGGGAESGRILLADDEPAVRQVVRAMLTREGFEVVDVADGLTAVETFDARSGDFAAVILDHAMPGLNGSEAFRRIRSASPDMPVVFVSGYTDSVVEPLDRRTTFLHKPFRSESLLAKVREVLAG